MAKSGGIARGNSSYIQDAFGNKTSEEIAQLFAANRKTTVSHSVIPYHEVRHRKPMMSSAITPYSQDQSFYETRPDLADDYEPYPVQNPGFDSTASQPYYEDNPAESNYAVPSDLQHTMEQEIQDGNLSDELVSSENMTELQHQGHKRQYLDITDDLISNSGSAPLASTPRQSPMRDLEPSSASLEVLQSVENVEDAEAPDEAEPPKKKKKLPGMKRRMMAGSSA